jgi:hypothetical protein
MPFSRCALPHHFTNISRTIHVNGLAHEYTGMKHLDDGLNRARHAVAVLLSSSSSSSTPSSYVASKAREAHRLLRELENAVDYAQREAMGENEGHKAVVLGRLHQVERAVKDLKAVVGKVCTALQREPFDGCTLCIVHGCTLCIFCQTLISLGVIL